LLNQVLYYVYLTTIIVSLICGLRNQKIVDASSRYMIALLAFALIGELSATLSYSLIRNKNPVFHFTSIISLYIVVCYFVSFLKPGKRSAFLVAAAVVMPVVGVVNAVYFQDITSLCTYTLRLRSVVVAVLGLIFLYRILVTDEIISPSGYPHFWFTLSLLTIYSVTFFFWSYIRVLFIKGQYEELTRNIHIGLNIVAYGSIGFVLFRYPKMKWNDK
jgi:uncharacterized membrane protein YeaQ/YmgE (transglycosylase-associated protein family)